MKKSLMGVLVVGLLAAFQVSADTSGSVSAGEKIAEAACMACHGSKGVSSVPNFPKLAGQGAKYLLKQMNDVKSGARNIVEMTGILDGYSDQDLKNIAAYYASQPISVGQANAELAKEGEKLYRAGNPATKVAACIACHGPGGTGIEAAAFPVLSGQHAQYTETQLRNFRVGKRANDGDQRYMRAVAARLSDREIEAVANYIQGLYK